MHKMMHFKHDADKLSGNAQSGDTMTGDLEL